MTDQWKAAKAAITKAITDSYGAGEYGTELSAQRVIKALSEAGFAVVPRKMTAGMQNWGPDPVDWRDTIRAWEIERDQPVSRETPEQGDGSR